MPADGMAWLPREEILSYEEIERVTRICVERFGFTSVRLTGGEPTVRAGLPVLVERLAGLGVEVALTTNGATLAMLAEDLRSAGLSRINISLDSLRADRFEAMTRRPALASVLEGIDAASAAGLDPVKINVVLMRGVNEDEILDFAAFGRDRGLGVRFIEFMPLDADEGWTRDQVVSADEIIATIDAEFPLTPIDRGPAPASTWLYGDGLGTVGVIASVTQPFCSSCDRIRLTAEGELRSCLFATREADLRPILRGGGDDDALAAAIAAEVGTKWAGHRIGTPVFVRPARSMSQIGG